MPNTLSSAKCDQPIKAGEEFYTWQHNHCPPTYRHKQHGGPKQSELCTGKMSGVYAALETAQDDIDAARGANDASGLSDILRSCASEVEQVKDEYEEARSNMPDHLQDCGTGAEMEEKAQALEEFCDTLENAANECEDWDMGTECPEPGEDHTEECASNEEVEPAEGEEATGEFQPCDCGFDGLEQEKEDWENEQTQKLEEAFDAAENALQEFSL